MTQQITAPLHVELKWDEQTRFHVKSPSGATSVLDGQKQVGLSPMESLLAALCGCMAIDVVNILKKMRAEFSGLSVSASGEQNPEPPKFYRRISIRFLIKGDVDPDRVEHAVQLSFKTYCSVFHTLRSDIDVTHTIEMEK